MFTDLTKVQINSERNATLAIRITENHVHNLIFNLETFAHIMSKDVQNWYGPIHGRYWNLQKLSTTVLNYLMKDMNTTIGFLCNNGMILENNLKML